MRNLEIKNNDSLAPCGRESQSGRSMIEMLGVLAIIGVLSVGGIAGYSKAMTKYRINKTIEQITLIAGNVRTFFAPQGNYDGLSSDTTSGKAIIKKAKLVPDEMWEDGKTLPQNVWGVSVYLYPANKSSNGDKKAFYMQYNMPKEYDICIEIFSYDWTNAGVKLISLTGPGPSDNVKAPFSLEKAIDLCTAWMSKPAKAALPSIPSLFFFDVNDNCVSTEGYNRCS
ncbi:MAG: hypothetical protein IKO06_04310 [Alphaproteobacteria bacterium]|nr:hypothetical protein [Alphaproteobacteria bacterium]